MDDYRHRKAAMAKEKPSYVKYKMENGVAIKKEKNALNIRA